LRQSKPRSLIQCHDDLQAVINLHLPYIILLKVDPQNDKNDAETGRQRENVCRPVIYLLVATVAIEDPERHVRKASHRGSKQQ